MPRPALQIIRDEHAAVAAVLRSLLQMIEHSPDEEPARFFDVMRAMLFYIDEFPERRHHPKESDLLFPKVARVSPQLMPVIRRLEDDHLAGESRVRELQHRLLGWELLGDSRRESFQQAARDYADFYLAHMRIEETEILPTAVQLLSPADWAELDAAFQEHRDPIATGTHDPVYDRLFTRIVMKTPAPIGVGPAF